MQLIDQYEKSRRGNFFGRTGLCYFPKRDFDFNVIIRSILYNELTSYLSYQVGSAITFYADAEKEYEECQPKSSGNKKSIDGGINTFRSYFKTGVIFLLLPKPVLPAQCQSLQKPLLG